MRQAAKKAAKGAIRLYQLLVSSWLRGHCRFAPSCSEYAAEAIDKHGVIKGGWLAVKRIGRCHPWGGQGFDPVPGENNAQHSAKSRYKHTHL